MGSKTISGLSFRFTLDELCNLGYDLQEKYIKEMRVLTLNYIRRVTSKYLIPDGYVIVETDPKL